MKNKTLVHLPRKSEIENKKVVSKKKKCNVPFLYFYCVEASIETKYIFW